MKYFAIFGNPVFHSKSPLMHNLVFKNFNFNGCYGRYLLKDGKRLKEKFLELGLKGINITVPHKEEAYLACDYLDPFAKKVGAVNTIINRDGKLYGYNTDALGFLKAIDELKDIKNVLFLGAGGTARATSSILRDEGYKVTILNRSEARLKSFKDNRFETYTFNNFTPKKYDLVINMTSAGLEDNSLPAPTDILDRVLPLAKASFDVIYGKETPFLKLSKSYSKPTKDGSDMLLYQGLIASEYFMNNLYNFEEIEPIMKKAFI
ncbi:MAG: shikimate dehydrogenase [Sulfurovum sp.]|nr:shikimate dehydrogenase [Sulfurovaceae bacterium]